MDADKSEIVACIKSFSSDTEDTLPDSASSNGGGIVRKRLMNGLDANNPVVRQSEPLRAQGCILLSGGSGMLGSSIARTLQSDGTSLLRLVRNGPAGADTVRWSPSESHVSAPERLEGITAAIHLSGANVADRRWTSAYRREIWESRVHTTRVLAETLARLQQPPQVLMAASAVGFYGDRGDEILDENSTPGSGFLPELCTAWEAAAKPAIDAGIRVVHLRTGVVLAREAGALKKMLRVFQIGLGGKLGSGRQWMSWIAESDLVAAVRFLLTAEAISGPVNIVAPNPVSNAEFTRDLARALHRPAFLPAPAFGLRMIFGQMADEALLASTRAFPAKLHQAGFSYRFPELHQALAHTLR